jgi:anti-anti-sigma regulatory factor
MLRITMVQDEAGEPRLRLEGKLITEWVDEFRRACQTVRAANDHVGLDLSGLSFIDALGVAALRELLQQDTSVISIPPFIGELLKET